MIIEHVEAGSVSVLTEPITDVNSHPSRALGVGRFTHVGAGKGRVRALLRLIGPWPLRPSVATAFVAVFLLVWVGSAVSSEGMPVSPENQQRLLLAIPSAVIIGLVLYLAKRLFGPRAERLGPYLAILALAALAGSVFRAATEQLPEEAFSAIEAVIAFSAVRLFLFLVVIHAILGRITARLENQVQVASEALQESHRFQQRLIEADERMRAQVATLLHDRVQAGLIAACLELTDVANQDDPEGSERSIRAVVGRLEAIRDIDVRAAARTLSPHLDSLDLRTALEDLAAQYLPGMQTEVSMPSDRSALLDRAHLAALLGTYRIAEQSLLNSAVHGHARHCRVMVRIEDDALILHVIDDGIGSPQAPEPGLGTFVNDTWAALLRGSWQLESRPGGGTEVSARIPLDGPDHAEVSAAFTGAAR